MDQVRHAFNTSWHGAWGILACNPFTAGNKKEHMATRVLMSRQHLSRIFFTASFDGGFDEDFDAKSGADFGANFGANSDADFDADFGADFGSNFGTYFGADFCADYGARIITRGF